jgi:UDP-N-acetylglucosamine transferase subunit ALG13
MIFITVGTSHVPFDRLVRAVDLIAGAEPVIVQHGASQVRPVRATLVDFLPFDEVMEHMRFARVVVTHAGVGSVMAALSAGKRPLVVPRRRSFRETSDDHQLEFARRLAREELVTAVEDPNRLPSAVAAEARPAIEPDGGESPLVEDLAGYLRSLIPYATDRGGCQG